MWRQSLISFPIPILSSAVTINFTSTQRRKKAARHWGFTHLEFYCWLSGKKNPLDIVLLNYIYTSKGNLKVLDLMAQTSCWVQLVEVSRSEGGSPSSVDQCPLLGFSTLMCILITELPKQMPFSPLCLMVRGLSFSLGSPALSPPPRSHLHTQEFQFPDCPVKFGIAAPLM